MRTRQILAILLVLGMCISFLKGVFVIFILIILGLLLIRLLADLYWWKKDKDY